MKKFRMVTALLAAAFFGSAAILAADPVSDVSKTGSLKLASLSPSAGLARHPQMTPIPEGLLEKMLGLPATAPKHRQFAGRCGSSNYYCDSPGFTYCCGNSTDGFYCAADVNGC